MHACFGTGPLNKALGQAIVSKTLSTEEGHSNRPAEIPTKNATIVQTPRPKSKLIDRGRGIRIKE